MPADRHCELLQALLDEQIANQKRLLEIAAVQRELLADIIKRLQDEQD